MARQFRAAQAPHNTSISLVAAAAAAVITHRLNPNQEVEFKEGPALTLNLTEATLVNEVTTTNTAAVAVVAVSDNHPRVKVATHHPQDLEWECLAPRLPTTKGHHSITDSMTCFRTPALNQ